MYDLENSVGNLKILEELDLIYNYQFFSRF